MKKTNLRALTSDDIEKTLDWHNQIRSDEDYCIREQQASYITDFANENAVLSDDNTYLWNVLDVNSSI